MTNMLPNVVYIGPDKAGSTWLFRYLRWREDSFVPPAKDIYFFDKEYNRGVSWYAAFFDGSQGTTIRADISHDYLYSPASAQRIHHLIPEATLIVSPREPLDRAQSAYLFLRKHRLYRGSFAEALVEVPALLDHGLYGKHIHPYIDLFGHDQIVVVPFDLLRSSPEKYARRLCDALGVTHHKLPGELMSPAMPAAQARFGPIARAAKASALLARRAGLVNLVGRMKSSRLINGMLYKPIRDRPGLSVEVEKKVRLQIAPDVLHFDELMGTDLASAWGYKL